MSDTPQTLALITLAQNYRGDVVRQINRRSTLLRVLPIVRGEGKNCAFTPEADGMVAENYSEGADAANFGSDAQAGAVLNWGLYRANFKVTGLALAASRSSATPLGNVAMWGRNLVNASGKLASTINAGLHTGNGTGTLIAGLGVACGSASNTYATIDRSVSGNAYFRPVVVDPGSLTAPTFALIRDDIRQIYEACGENPEIATCPPAVFNKIGSLFDATRRYTQEVTTARGTIRLDQGYQGLEIDGCVFLKDKDAAANSITYLNTNHVRVEYLDPLTEEQRRLFAEMVQADDGYGTLPLGFAYEMLAKTGDAIKAEVKCYLQLVVDRPNSCGQRVNVAT